jgi:hypothetical protein
VRQRESWVIRWREHGERRGTLGINADTIYCAITSIVRSSYNGWVYNLAVEEDETYTTVAGVVHNCRWFRMPPHKIQDLSEATYSNIEFQNIEYVTDTLQSWLARWEQELKRKIFGIDSPYYAKHLVQGLLRGDHAARASFYTAMFKIGVLSPNDIRETEDLNSIGPDGDEYFVEANNLVPIRQVVGMSSPPLVPANAPARISPLPPGRNGHAGAPDHFLQPPLQKIRHIERDAKGLITRIIDDPIPQDTLYGDDD